MLHLCVCLDLLHFNSFLTSYAVEARLWLTVMHTIKINGQRLADWSERDCITLWSCFCSLLTSNCKFSTSCLPYFLNILTQITKFFVISSYIDDIETNLPTRKRTLRVFTWQFEKIVSKVCFDASFMCLFRFVAFRVTLKDLCFWTQRYGLLARIQLGKLTKNGRLVQMIPYYNLKFFL